MTRNVLLCLNLCLLLIFGLALEAYPNDLGSDMDGIVAQRTSNSEMMDLWFKSYAKGDYVKADKLWQKLLKDCAKREEIGDILENVNERCWFAEDTATRKVDPEKAYYHLLVCTERMLGKEHRFVADLCTFLATYAEARHDYEKAKQYRLRDLKLHEKALGDQNHQVIEANQEVGHLLVVMKQYDQAGPYLKKALTISKQQGITTTYQKARSDYLKVLKATKSNTK